MIPTISVEPTPSKLGVCNCCGHESLDDTVKHVKFRWRDEEISGGTAVSLCRKCRAEAAKVLVESLL